MRTYTLYSKLRDVCGSKIDLPRSLTQSDPLETRTRSPTRSIEILDNTSPKKKKKKLLSRANGGPQQTQTRHHPLDILSVRQTPTDKGMKMNMIMISMIIMMMFKMIMIIRFSIQEIYCVFCVQLEQPQNINLNLN